MVKCKRGYKDLRGICKKDIAHELFTFDARDRVIRLDNNGKNLDIYITAGGKPIVMKDKDVVAGSKREFNRFFEDFKDFVGQTYDVKPDKVKILKVEALPDNHPDKEFAEFVIDAQYQSNPKRNTVIGVKEDLGFQIFMD